MMNERAGAEPNRSRTALPLEKRLGMHCGG